MMDFSINDVLSRRPLNENAVSAAGSKSPGGRTNPILRGYVKSSPEYLGLMVGSRLNEINAFAQFHGYDASLLRQIAEDAVSAGRVPDLTAVVPDTYDKVTIARFISDVMLGLGESVSADEPRMSGYEDNEGRGEVEENLVQKMSASLKNALQLGLKLSKGDKKKAIAYAKKHSTAGKGVWKAVLNDLGWSLSEAAAAYAGADKGKSDDGEGLDKPGEEDDDVDNDGDSDSSDSYLKNRRAKVKAAVNEGKRWTIDAINVMDQGELFDVASQINLKSKKRLADIRQIKLQPAILKHLRGEVLKHLKKKGMIESVSEGYDSTLQALYGEADGSVYKYKGRQWWFLPKTKQKNGGWKGLYFDEEFHSKPVTKSISKNDLRHWVKGGSPSKRTIKAFAKKGETISEARVFNKVEESIKSDLSRLNRSLPHGLNLGAIRDALGRGGRRALVDDPSAVITGKQAGLLAKNKLITIMDGPFGRQVELTQKGKNYLDGYEDRYDGIVEHHEKPLPSMLENMMSKTGSKVSNGISRDTNMTYFQENGATKDEALSTINWGREGTRVQKDFDDEEDEVEESLGIDAGEARQIARDYVDKFSVQLTRKNTKEREVAKELYGVWGSITGTAEAKVAAREVMKLIDNRNYKARFAGRTESLNSTTAMLTEDELPLSRAAGEISGSTKSSRDDHEWDKQDLKVLKSALLKVAAKAKSIRALDGTVYDTPVVNKTMRVLSLSLTAKDNEFDAIWLMKIYYMKGGCAVANEREVGYEVSANSELRGRAWLMKQAAGIFKSAKLKHKAVYRNYGVGDITLSEDTDTPKGVIEGLEVSKEKGQVVRSHVLEKARAFMQQSSKKRGMGAYGESGDEDFARARELMAVSRKSPQWWSAHYHHYLQYCPGGVVNTLAAS